MKHLVRNAFLGAVGLVAASLPAHATSSIAIQDSPLLNSSETAPLKMVQRNENPGGAGFRNENPGGAGFRNENPGGAGMKKAKKPKKKKVAG